MSILLSPSTTVLVQGITGKEGQKAADWMKKAGTKVVAGVTPGKGGQTVDGVPVFGSVQEALEQFPNLQATSIYVPPRFALSAVVEAAAAGLKLIHVIAEGVPVQDTAKMISLCQQKKAVLIGPSSIGVMAPGIGKLGSIGGEKNEQFLPGSIGLISKSGGLASEFSMMLTSHGFGQSTVVGIGGDQLIGASYADLFPLYEADEQTKVVVIIGEVGGSYEEAAAQAIGKKILTKPVIAFISGLFAETLPQGVSFGHAGAIVEKGQGTRRGKIEALKAAGALIAEKPEDVLTLVQQIME